MDKNDIEKEAEEYIQNGAIFVNNKVTVGSIKQAFLAGFEAGKPKWHKVADGDYPPVEVGSFTIDVLTDRGDVAYYSYDNECWVVEPSSAEIDPPIAWCELPTFKE